MADPGTALSALWCQEEGFLSCWPELEPLVEAQHAERSRTTPLLPLLVDTAAYTALDSVGALVLVTLRHEGALIGYTSSLVGPALHASHLCCAYLDVYYVAPDHRQGGTARRLFEATEAVWQRRGVTRAYCMAPDALLSRWVHRQGWQVEALLYHKDL
jgi:GNAT superfamily N-acetyltransferase